MVAPNTVNREIFVVVAEGYENKSHEIFSTANFSSFFTATAYRSEAFSGSLSHTNDSPTAASHTSLYKWWYTTFPFKNRFHGSYFLRMFLPPALATHYKCYAITKFHVKIFS